MHLEQGYAIRCTKPTLLWVGDSLRTTSNTIQHPDLSNEWVILESKDLESTIRCLAWNKVDVIVTDQDMPDEEELGWIEALRKETVATNIPVVMLTSTGDRTLKRRALTLGATDLLRKPLELEDLLARINSLLRLKRTQDELERKNVELEALISERTRQLEESRLEVVWRLSKAAETRDVETGNHTLRVGYYSQVVAQALGLSRAYQEKLLLAAPLHDIGKLGIPDVILQKNGPLTKSEFEIMKTHTTIGHEILMASYAPPKSYNLEFGTRRVSRSPFIELAATIALQHHEKWNGYGYPNGLTGDAIDLGARIVAVADAFDAIRSERPYKRAIAEPEAIEILKKSVHEHFDADVVAAFLDSLSAIRSIGKDLSDSSLPLAA